jgi:hypothetical protein
MNGSSSAYIISAKQNTTSYQIMKVTMAFSILLVVPARMTVVGASSCSRALARAELVVT